jgi:predicted AAA+ superfamily ATPase
VADNAGPEEAASARAALGSGSLGPRARLALLGRGFGDGGPGARLALGPFTLPEVGAGSRTSHWLRGGFPEALAAPSDAAAAAWLARYADSISEERFAAAGLPWAPGRSRALLSMIAEAQGGALNESAAARSLGLSRPTVARAAAALERAGLLRSLPCLAPPDGRRAPRAPALYLRDSGLYNALSGIANVEALLGSVRLAASWEGYAVEQIAAALPPGVSAARYATRSGAALELVLSRGGAVLAALSIRWARPAGPRRAAVAAAEELGAARRWLVLPEAEEREAGGGFIAMGISRAVELASDLS